LVIKSYMTKVIMVSNYNKFIKREVT